jgi:hypothetical protein
MSASVRSFFEDFGVRVFGGWHRVVRPGTEEGLFPYDESTQDLFDLEAANKAPESTRKSISTGEVSPSATVAYLAKAKALQLLAEIHFAEGDLAAAEVEIRQTISLLDGVSIHQASILQRLQESPAEDNASEQAKVERLSGVSQQTFSHQPR